jgi:hypothetical protein
MAGEQKQTQWAGRSGKGAEAGWCISPFQATLAFLDQLASGPLGRDAVRLRKVIALQLSFTGWNGLIGEDRCGVGGRKRAYRQWVGERGPTAGGWEK